MRQYCNETGEDVTDFSERFAYHCLRLVMLPLVTLISFFIWNRSAYELFFSVDIVAGFSFFLVAVLLVISGVLLVLRLVDTDYMDVEQYESSMNHLFVVLLFTFLPATVLFFLPVVIEQIMMLTILVFLF